MSRSKSPHILVALAVVLGSACADETGILIRVTTADGIELPATKLRVYVGVDKIRTAIDENNTEKVHNRYVDEKSPVDVSLVGRDLGSDPYSLLIRPGDDFDRELAIGAVVYDGDVPMGFASLSKPVTFTSAKVLEWQLELKPIDSGRDMFRAKDHECVKWRFEGAIEWTYVGRKPDEDCDGSQPEPLGGGDCEPRDPNIYPSQNENCTNGFDDNCNGLKDDLEDDNVDGDPYSICQGDCDDDNAAVYPGAPEICDGVDNDCNRLCDEASDVDGDSWTTCGSVLADEGKCVSPPDDKVNDSGHDDDATVYPGAPEICDGKDNDLDGTCDNGDSDYEDPVFGKIDPDGDGYTWCYSRVDHCGTIDVFDCEPNDPLVHPGAQEFCDGIDNDCDSLYAQNSPCFFYNGSGLCSLGRSECTESLGVSDLTAGCDLGPAPVAGLAEGLACDDYIACNQYSDPWQCVLDGFDGSDGASTECFVVSDVNGQCAGDTVEIPGQEPFDTCEWKLLGASQQQGFTVTLGNALSHTGCPAQLRVRPTAVSGKALIGIEFRNGDAGYTQVIDLKDVQVKSCEGRKGLECQGWTTL